MTHTSTNGYGEGVCNPLHWQRVRYKWVKKAVTNPFSSLNQNPRAGYPSSFIRHVLILARSRCQLPHAVRVMNQVLAHLGLEQHPDKTGTCPAKPAERQRIGQPIPAGPTPPPSTPLRSLSHHFPRQRHPLAGAKQKRKNTKI